MSRVYLFGAAFAAVVLAGAGFYLYRNRQLFTPTSDQNLAHQAVTGVVQSLTGDPNQTLGGWFFDLFNPEAGLAEGERHVAPGVIMREEAPAGASFGGWLSELFSSSSPVPSELEPLPPSDAPLWP